MVSTRSRFPSFGPRNSERFIKVILVSIATNRISLVRLQAVSILEDSHLQKSECVLVQNAYSHNGHAILAVALHYKYTVFTVENNDQECMWVQKQFPDVRIRSTIELFCRFLLRNRTKTRIFSFYRREKVFAATIITY